MSDFIIFYKVDEKETGIIQERGSLHIITLMCSNRNINNSS